MLASEASMPKRVAILQDAENPESPELIAQAVIDVSKAARKLLGSKLTEDAIITLIRNKIPQSRYYGQKNTGKKAIREVLQTAAKLDRFYIKKSKKGAKS